jgi:hypothetical protein
MNIKIALALFASTTLLAGLACDTGQILEPDQATQAVMETRAAAAAAASGPATDAQYVEGDEVEFTGVSFLIGLAANAGDTDMVTHVERGATGTVLESTAYDGAAWYRVQTDAGTGWVKANALQRMPTAVEGLEVGSQARIAGTGFLIMLRDAAGSIRQIAGQERGVIVTILEIRDVGGETWYFVDAPTGDGWLPAENLEPIEAEAGAEGTGTPAATATAGA